jgi:acetyl-CoA acetyltransferase
MESSKVSNKKGRRVFVVGVGMTKFVKPGSHDLTYIDFGSQAVRRALIDSGVNYTDIEQAYVGYIFQSSCAGQRVLYEVGMTGIPVVNVNNNCATGSSAFNLAYNGVKYGMSECSLALGFDIMQKGPLPMDLAGPSHPVFKYSVPLLEKGKFNPKLPAAPQLFGAAALEHMEKYGTKIDHLNKISVKNYSHGFNNPYAQFRKQHQEKDVANAPMITYPLTKLNCCPTSDGAACAIICSEEYVIKHGLQDQAIEVLSSVLGTDKADSFNGSHIDNIGGKLTKYTVEKAYKEAGVKPEQVQVVELHDCFSANELVTYEALGLCKEGEGSKFIEKGDNTYGGKFVVNPSGGLTSKGHPLGATGLAQITELTWQLRKMSEKRQVKDAQVALAHNLGLGSAVVITILKKYNQNFDLKPHHTSDPTKLEKIEKDPQFAKLSMQPKF